MDITGHNLALIASLSTLLDERNVTRAAGRLGISQPALSAQLARMRDLFGDPLLTPAISGKGMVLTPLAVQMKDPLRAALQRVRDIVTEPVTFDPLLSDRVFSIGANDNAGAIVGVRLIPRLQPGRPGIRLALRSIDFRKLPEQLETGEIDIALVGENMLPTSMSHQALTVDGYRLAQRKDHPRGKSPPGLDEYVKLEHILVSGEGGGFHGFVDDILQARGLTRRVVMSVPYYGIVPLLLQSTDLVCTLPGRFLERYAADLDALPLPFDTRRFALHATWHPRFDSDPGHVWLRRQLADCMAD
ncbi:MAG TPA: LysR family transcriptional regulator [Aliidongia sp.]|uniref:LysR family transcriptional regulator n=1 Tax=Aliidongia sp. TaxID=1914230 RepID=UPI002DDCDFFF|nr:LysR family transcriptional regulator [Aliidongia sp.]HEV2675986.1 LysR family transcriptional regulator [Aliidongia sp.]